MAKDKETAAKSKISSQVNFFFFYVVHSVAVLIFKTSFVVRIIWKKNIYTRYIYTYTMNLNIRDTVCDDIYTGKTAYISSSWFHLLDSKLSSESEILSIPTDKKHIGRPREPSSLVFIDVLCSI